MWKRIGGLWNVTFYNEKSVLNVLVGSMMTVYGIYKGPFGFRLRD